MVPAEKLPPRRYLLGTHAAQLQVKIVFWPQATMIHTMKDKLSFFLIKRI